jgi:hypothetical protein
LEFGPNDQALDFEREKIHDPAVRCSSDKGDAKVFADLPDKVIANLRVARNGRSSVLRRPLRASASGLEPVSYGDELFGIAGGRSGKRILAVEP